MRNPKLASLWCWMIVFVLAGTLYGWNGSQQQRDRLRTADTQDSLPVSEVLQKYTDISALPMDKRRTAFSSASAKDRSHFVRIHLALYLVSHPDLNEEQKEVILEGMSLATPELYSDTSDGKAKVAESLRQFGSRIRAAFSQEEAPRIFASLGAPEPDERLQKYSAISVLPMDKRRTAFTSALPQDSSDLMRTHLALYLATHSDLNEEQKEVILEGISLATPELYSNTPDREAKVAEALRQFGSRIRAAFSQEEAARIFATLGAPEPDNDRLLKYRHKLPPLKADKKATLTTATLKHKSNVMRTPVALRLSEQYPSGSRVKLLNWSGETNDREATVNQPKPDCECAYWDYFLDYCGIWKTCKLLNANCNITSWGCGTLLAYQCDGKCVLKSSLTSLEECEFVGWFWNSYSSSCQEELGDPANEGCEYGIWGFWNPHNSCSGW